MDLLSSVSDEDDAVQLITDGQNFVPSEIYNVFFFFFFPVSLEYTQCRLVNYY